MNGWVDGVPPCGGASPVRATCTLSPTPPKVSSKDPPHPPTHPTHQEQEKEKEEEKRRLAFITHPYPPTHRPSSTGRQRGPFSHPHPPTHPPTHPTLSSQ